MEETHHLLPVGSPQLARRTVWKSYCSVSDASSARYTCPRAQEQARQAALSADPPPDELPQGRDWEEDIVVGVQIPLFRRIPSHIIFCQWEVLNWHEERCGKAIVVCADPPPDELPQGRDWEEDIVVGVHAVPSMNHLHVFGFQLSLFLGTRCHRTHQMDVGAFWSGRGGEGAATQIWEGLCPGAGEAGGAERGSAARRTTAGSGL
jgi:hypothetical protein